MNPETMEKVPADGETIGEVMFRGNIVMRDGEVQDKPLGKPVRFTETLNG